jgi:hypothetical protein
VPVSYFNLATISHKRRRIKNSTEYKGSKTERHRFIPK